MNKKELVSLIATKLDVTKKDAEVVLNVVSESIVEGLVEHGQVKTDLGIFKVADKAARTARNPKTGEEINVPAKRVPTLKVSKAFKENF
ncbi:HU family DNA-binding protein [Fictibacillus nanhaiensis]|uniref:HU family DNA-binding protein n=1 Tax=Fictibacillus nanhaiensis TaxID=742169 RepID=UPI002E201523|nr:HU family DNA-binding protein [Fictibacillus nanhaiensis]